MNADPDGDFNREVELSILPHGQILAGLGISPEMFEAALAEALEQREALAARDDVDDDDIPFLEETMLVIKGVTFKLADLAEIEVHGWDA